MSFVKTTEMPSNFYRDLENMLTEEILNNINRENITISGGIKKGKIGDQQTG